MTSLPDASCSCWRKPEADCIEKLVSERKSVHSSRKTRIGQSEVRLVCHRVAFMRRRRVIRHRHNVTWRLLPAATALCQHCAVSVFGVANKSREGRRANEWAQQFSKTSIAGNRSHISRQRGGGGGEIKGGVYCRDA